MHVMLGRGFWSSALFLLASLGACKSESERKLTDTEGRTFTAQCERSGACTLSQTSGARRKDEKTAQSLLLTGHIIGICDVEPGQAPGPPSDCRALVCRSDGDCPPSHGLKNGQCLDALCTDAAQPLVATDSIMLCLAGSGLGREQPSQVERFALGLNCGSPCKVLAPCRQP